MKYFSLLIFLFLVSVSIVPSASAQDCLNLLTKVQETVKLNQQAAIVEADKLKQMLDSAQCSSEIIYSEAYNELGLLYWETHTFKNAIYCLEKSVEIKLKSIDSLDVLLMENYFNLSGAYQESGQQEIATKYINLGIAVAAQAYGEKSPSYIEALYRAGLFFLTQGDYKSCLDKLEDALSRIRPDQKSLDILKGKILIDKSAVQKLMGDFLESEKTIMLAIQKVGGKDDQLHLVAVERLASLRLEHGDFGTSEQIFLRSLNIKKRLEDVDSLALLETYNNLGVLYYKLNDLANAQYYFEKNVSYSKNHPVFYASCINNLGVIYLKKNEWDRAEECFKEATSIYRSIYGAIHPDYSSSLNNLAGLYRTKGDIDLAFSLYNQVLDIDKVVFGRQHPKYATSLNNLAIIYLVSNQLALGKNLLEEALKIRKKALGEYHPLYAKSLNDLGLYHLALGDTTAALQNFDQALFYELHHMNEIFSVLTNVQREGFFELIKSNIERFSALAFTINKDNSFWSEKALNYYINSKSALFYASDKMRTAVLTSERSNIKDKFNEWRKIVYQLADSYLLTEEERDKMGISILDLEKQSHDLEKMLAQSLKAFSNQDDRVFHNWQDISKALPDSTYLVEIVHYRKYNLKLDKNGFNQGFDDQSTYLAFVIHPEEEKLPSYINYSPYVDLEKSYAVYKNLIKYGIKDTVSFKTYWQPIHKAIKGTKKIYLASDGIFHKINPSVLFNPDDNQFIADAYQIINITSGKDLISRNPIELSQHAEIFGNPAYFTLDTNEALEPLPGAELEAADISDILSEKGWEVNSHYQLAATEDKIKAMVSPGILHIATHGYFEKSDNSVNPLFSSGLYLSKTEDSSNDGILSAYEAMNLILDDTDLVVLSACETGLGKIKNGEGVFGLQRAFLVAGARYLIISLVKVEDRATRSFMNLFYEQISTHGNIEHAFFEARSRFKAKYPNPYDWGSFVLVSKN